MTSQQAAYRMRVITLAADAGLDLLAARLPALRLRPESRIPDGLILTPHDLRTGDPTVASDLYRGDFSLGGIRVDAGAHSPFSIRPPNNLWLDELHGFSWMRHLQAADSDISRLHARSLTADWIELHARKSYGPQKTQVLARRIISWINHSPMFLDDAEPEFYRIVMKSLGQQIRQLARIGKRAPDGVPRLLSAIALCFSALCLNRQEKLLPMAVKFLSSELKRQILPDGGHISRHTGIGADLLLDLLPLRQTFSGRDIAPPRELMSAIDRMMPMVRFFRHGDGNFALFNGMGVTTPGDAAAVLALDDIQGRPLANAQHSGYQRISAGQTRILMDTGTPPPIAVSGQAHAGCLSFELSSGENRIVVNCGSPRNMGPEWWQAARLTPAHSTLSIDGASSCHFLGGWLVRFAGVVISQGPRRVQCSREDLARETVIEASHDGYQRSFGAVHVRRIKVSTDSGQAGGRIDGEDRLMRPSGGGSLRGGEDRTGQLRFHLHPNVRAKLSADGKSVLMVLPNDEGWRFSAVGADPEIEDSVFLADPKGPRRSSQIVLKAGFEKEMIIKWSFRRTSGGKPRMVKDRPAPKRQ